MEGRLLLQVFQFLFNSGAGIFHDMEGSEGSGYFVYHGGVFLVEFRACCADGILLKECHCCKAVDKESEGNAKEDVLAHLFLLMQHRLLEAFIEWY